MFRDKTRLFKLKQESQRDFRRRFLLRELMMINTQRRQSMVDVMNSAQAVDNLDLTGSLEGLTTGRSSFSGDTLST
ncbi:hypothetical protein PoB_006211500 [Plakobranchus ocellatus]|uniref:Uncharacterized protein n=1 Tax=Plakobranchus ocellatus TaxID=259542 RepID=A0AAV4CUP7_9GAST|nr:hypothetical protein PoB_006211500 [Plakobranchus ocellatus]